MWNITIRPLRESTREKIKTFKDNFHGIDAVDLSDITIDANMVMTVTTENLIIMKYLFLKFPEQIYKKDINKSNAKVISLMDIPGIKKIILINRDLSNPRFLATKIVDEMTKYCRNKKNNELLIRFLTSIITISKTKRISKDTPEIVQLYVRVSEKISNSFDEYCKFYCWINGYNTIHFVKFVDLFINAIQYGK